MVDALKNKIIESHKPIGVKKSTNWKLPPEDFAYGYKVKPDAEDVSVITRSWVEHKPSKPIEPKPDFIKINKLAVEKKIVDPKSNKEFRKTVDIRQKIPEGKKPSKNDPGMAEVIYGKRNRTPTPVKDVINNEFGNKFEEDLKKNYEKVINEKTFNTKNDTLQSKENVKKNKKEDENKNNIAVVKSKKYNDVKSKVKENIKNFKTSSKADDLDDLINKVEKEIKQLESNKK